MDRIADRPFSKFEKGLIYFFLLGIIPLLGALVEYRSAFLERRMGDLDCFLRAGWAVRTGGDLYAVTSDNDWHYNYPPLYAILVAPLADPPRGEEPSGYLPYALSTAICYLINVFCLFFAAHVLASAFEETSADASFRVQPRFCRRWWILRLWPVLICFLPIGHTLMRGQVNVIVLASLCAACAGWMRQQRFRAGLWLAFAICIKVIPLYLLVYPLWKRDARGLLGCSVGLFVGLVLIPALVFGPAGTETHYRTYAKVFLGPLFKINDDASRREEILGVNSTDSIGVKNALHNWMYPDADKRPEDLHSMAKAAYLLLGFAMTFLTLWPDARRLNETPARTANVFAGLIVLMAIFSPVSHRHYLMFCLPIVTALLASTWKGQPTNRLPWWLTTSFIVFNVTIFLAYLPDFEVFAKDRCVALFATLPLWGIPVWLLWRGPSATRADVAPQETRAAA